VRVRAEGGGRSSRERDICTAFGCPKPPEVRVKESCTPAVYNDPQLEAAARKVFVAILGEAAVEHPLATMGGEDFGRYARALGIPGLLFRLGAVPAQAQRAAAQPGATPLPTLHSSRFAPDTPIVLRTGVRATTGLLLALLPRARSAAS
jgi:hippurate hydrolase